MTALSVLAAFLVGVGAIVGVYWALTQLPGVMLQRKLQQRLREAGPAEPGAEEEGVAALIKGKIEGPLPALDRLMAGTARGTALHRWIDQSGVRLSVSATLLLAVGLGALGALAITLFVRAPLAPVVAAIAGAALPFGFLHRRRAARLAKFEELFPEALDLISRAVRAGHAFTTGMKMAADELGEPVGPEFRKTFDEQNFGLPIKDALNNLAERVPLLDVRFFTTAVLIQRETGGNLSEILDNLAHVVRERFKILRQVRVHTAHGRMTGYVLLALPAALAVVLYWLNPDHMSSLFTESMGHSMILGAIVLQVIGYFWISRVVKIEV